MQAGARRHGRSKFVHGSNRAVLLVRFSISQMDVPTRQSYTMAVVRAEERPAAAGITGVARTTGAALSPLFVGFMLPGILGSMCRSSSPTH